jgi:hypothetical protein
MKRKAIRKLLPKAGLALKNGFYLETSWILSSIIEVKLRRILTLISKDKLELSMGLEKCLRRIKGLHIKGSDPLLVKHFEIRLMDDLRVWKNKRNSIYQDMTNIHVRQGRIKRMVEEGIVLHQELNTAIKNFKKDLKQASIKNTALPVETNEQPARN